MARTGKRDERREPVASERVRRRAKNSLPEPSTLTRDEFYRARYGVPEPAPVIGRDPLQPSVGADGVAVDEGEPFDWAPDPLRRGE